MKHAVLLSLFGLFVLSCGAPPSVADGGDGDAGETIDAGGEDAGLEDAGLEDAGTPDSGLPDAGGEDAGSQDAGVPDAGRPDSGVPDAGLPDAGAPDAGPRDAGLVDGCPAPSFSEPPFRLRAMAANLTSGNYQSYDPGHGARIMRGASPDVVMIQEFNYGSNSTGDLRGLVTSTFDAGYEYQRGNGQIPNGVISRWPIVAQGEWPDPQVGNRGFTWAKIDLPGPNDLWVVSVHLLTSSGGTRNLEAQSLISRFNANIPASDYLLLGGDFNTDTRNEACFTTFSSRLVTAGPHPADQNGDQGTNRNRDKPYDIVLASPCLARRQTATVVGASVYDAGLVIDTRVYTPLSELAPAEAGDSASSNMQHMGVVKDFLIQP